LPCVSLAISWLKQPETKIKLSLFRYNVDKGGDGSGKKTRKKT